MLIGLIFVLSLGVFAFDDNGIPDIYGGHYSYNDKGQISGYVYVSREYKGWYVKCRGGFTNLSRNVLNEKKPFIPRTELKINNKKVWLISDWHRCTTPTPTPTTPSPTPTSTSPTPTSETPSPTPTTPTATPTTETATPTSTSIETPETNIPTDTPTEITTSTPIETSTPIVNVNSKNNTSGGLPQTGEGNIWTIIIVGITIILSGIMLFLILVKKKTYYDKF
jgi:LPXTG-motif cell wall-anchored protein